MFNNVWESHQPPSMQLAQAGLPRVSSGDTSIGINQSSLQSIENNRECRLWTSEERRHAIALTLAELQQKYPALPNGVHWNNIEKASFNVIDWITQTENLGAIYLNLPMVNRLAIHREYFQFVTL